MVYKLENDPQMRDNPCYLLYLAAFVYIITYLLSFIHYKIKGFFLQFLLGRDHLFMMADRQFF